MIDLIMDTFRLNEFGNFVYAKDITSSGAIRKKEGAIVNFKTDSNGVKGLCFRKSNKRYWISAGAAAFVIAYGRIPLFPGVVIIKASNNDYRAENLTYTLMSDIKYNGAMRIRSCKRGFQTQIYINKSRVVRFFRSKASAERFAFRLNRFNSRRLFREFWRDIEQPPIEEWSAPETTSVTEWRPEWVRP